MYDRLRMTTGGQMPPVVSQPSALRNGFAEWVTHHFGSIERFHQIYGMPLTDELWLDPALLRHMGMGEADGLPAGGTAMVAVLTERALLLWSADQGVTMAPLGRLFYIELRAGLGI